MPERTQLTQQDEALRQTRLDDTVRDGLRLIADSLAHTHPDRLMTTTDRQTEALITANATHPRNTDAAVELERQLLRRMPFVDGHVVTRGEYALWLHKTSWGA
ncbi:hypothetical protein EAO70_04850 [Streptomyces sp. adm13(2018)]|uniref:hypothetical protein n=1 Tax=Streptomyces sp. adm13(2018) TaxID=2479007 RepID=UPI0011CE67BB|nr:hypothetical protein [Streptomyces sp. adm13(2018)]TXS23104.1 hypothetical protein EAO70_04850 [Streptomyces sp. adm13(2018)]